MPQTDPISDMLSQVKNAVARRHKKTVMTHSKMREAVAAVLKREGFIENFQKMPDERRGEKRPWLHVYLRYDIDGGSAIRGVVRVSRPSRRVFAGYDEFPKVLDGLGITVVSTSKGILSDREARAQKIGGELICKVW